MFMEKGKNYRATYSIKWLCGYFSVKKKEETGSAQFLFHSGEPIFRASNFMKKKKSSHYPNRTKCKTNISNLVDAVFFAFIWVGFFFEKYVCKKNTGTLCEALLGLFSVVPSAHIRMEYFFGLSASNLQTYFRWQNCRP